MTAALAAGSEPLAGTGCRASVELTVGQPDLAVALSSGDVCVLGTWRLIALCEEACCKALDGRFGPDETTVASRVHFEHLAPVAAGAVVVAEATLERIQGRRFVFMVSASVRSEDRWGLVGAGRVTRVLVDRGAFIAKAGRT